MPTRGHVYWATVHALQELRDVTPGLPPIHYEVARLAVTHGRNAIVKRFLATEAEWLLMVDDDVVPRRDVLGMLDWPEVQGAIVGAPYLIMRPEVNIPYLCAFEQRPGASAVSPLPRLFSLTGLHACDALGTGCMAVHRRVLEDPTMRPAFQFGTDTDGLMTSSEDVRFCLRARKAGYTIHADFDRVPDHFPLSLSLNQIHASYHEAFLRAEEKKAASEARVVLA